MSAIDMVPEASARNKEKLQKVVLFWKKYAILKNVLPDFLSRSS